MVHAVSVPEKVRNVIMEDLRKYTRNATQVHAAMAKANKLLGLWVKDGSYMLCAILLAIREVATGEAASGEAATGVATTRETATAEVAIWEAAPGDAESRQTNWPYRKHVSPRLEARTTKI